MSYLALYRKYRPTSFDDFVGQLEIKDIIKNEILHNKISHAYLFSGPRGTGKTSTAKIIARMINCSNLSQDGKPCGECYSCRNFDNNSDIVEIDAASNNGVDEIRELRDKVNLLPTSGKYKIYIIDEVHMLTNQAFNALLKTLEEPPSHVIFILATTEFHKIPITVVSRCQRFQFLKFTLDDIVQRLKNISEKENILISDDVLYELARLSDGGLRDAINMLDQLSSFKESDFCVDDVYKLNGVISYNEFKNLLNFVYINDIVSLVNFFEDVDKSGKSFERFIEDLIAFLKDLLIYKNVGFLSFNIQEKSDCIQFLSNIYSGDIIYKLIILLNDVISKIKNSSFAKIMLITEFIKFSNEINNSSSILDVNNSKKGNDNQPINLIEANIKLDNNDKLTRGYVLSDKLKRIRINNTFAKASKENKELFLKKWIKVLEEAANNSDYSAIVGMLSDIEVLVVGEENVIFLAPYDSLLERLFSQINLIESLLVNVFGVSYKVVFLANDEWEFERKRYISQVKSSYKYEYIDEEMIEDKKIDEKSDEIDKLISIFGDDVIKYQ